MMVIGHCHFATYAPGRFRVPKSKSADEFFSAYADNGPFTVAQHQRESEGSKKPINMYRLRMHFVRNSVDDAIRVVADWLEQLHNDTAKAGGTSMHTGDIARDQFNAYDTPRLRNGATLAAYTSGIANEAVGYNLIVFPDVSAVSTEALRALVF